jgi:hypothetical protein
MNMTFARRLALALTVAVAAVLTGCGKKAGSPGDSSGSAISKNQMQLISRKQGWQVGNIEARERARKALSSKSAPTDEDWQRLVKAAEEETNQFDLSLVLIFAERMSDKYRGPVLTWCERNMAQSEDQYAAVLGYYGYVRSGGIDKDAWANRLKARGQFYVQEVAKADERVAERKKRDGHLLAANRR